MSADIDPAEFTFEDRGRSWPFIESEDCDITAYGHVDKARLAEQVTDYDREIGGFDDADWAANDFAHKWVRPLDADRFVVCSAEDVDAFPVTTLWGAR